MRRAAALVIGLALLLAGACSNGEGSAEKLCRIVGSGSFGDLFERGLDPTDTDQALTQLRAAAVDLDQLHDAAPSEVRSAVRDELAYVDAVTKVLEEVDADDPAKVVAAVNALTGQRTAAQAASTKLQAYEQAHCGSTTVTG